MTILHAVLFCYLTLASFLLAERKSLLLPYPIAEQYYYKDLTAISVQMSFRQDLRRYLHWHMVSG